MSSDLDPLLKTLNLANTRKTWQLLVARAEKEDWPYDQFLQVLLSEELAHRRATRLTKASRAADFPFLRTIEEFDFTFQSTLRLASIGSLLGPDFVIEGRSVILFGKPGRGKTHLAIAIAYRAIQCGFEALFTTAAEMIEDLSTASRDGRLREALIRYVRPHVLIVDEVGYLSYGPDAANVLYHVVNDRHVRKRAMIFTTNKDPKRQWGAVLHDDDLAEAIVDRILERGRLLRLDGPSMRTKHLPPDELVADDQVTSSSSRVSGRTAAEFPEPTRARRSRGGGRSPGATIGRWWTVSRPDDREVVDRSSTPLTAPRRAPAQPTPKPKPNPKPSPTRSAARGPGPADFSSRRPPVREELYAFVQPERAGGRLGEKAAGPGSCGGGGAP